MTRLLRFRSKALLMGVACALGMLAAQGREARAGIVITMDVGVGPPIDLAAFTTPLVTDPGQLNNYGTVNLDLLNATLTGLGSAYQFSALGGDSNWAGAPSGGILSLHGGIYIPTGVTGSTVLTLTETESGFASPSGSSGGLLMSSSVGNYNDAGPPNSHSASSTLNGSVTAGPYTVPSTKTGPDPETGEASIATGPFVTPYTLTNFISFNLIPSATLQPTDGFSVTAKIVSTVIPEPASIVTMTMGLPIPLLGLTWMRRHRARAKA
jgi:hypothetical protein